MEIIITQIYMAIKLKQELIFGYLVLILLFNMTSLQDIKVVGIYSIMEYGIKYN
jgi:hypothetical protein